MRLTTIVVFSDESRGKLCNECLATWPTKHEAVE
jgi:hypothetical protein